MSKIGKLPVAVPAGVTVTVKDNEISVKGAKGELKQKFSKNVEVAFENNEVTVKALNSSRQANADHGLYRALINDMVKGVTTGFTKSLIINGVGFRAEVKGKVAADPSGKIDVSGINKQQIGEFCAQIRKLRLPEPYKGKGIRYSTEVIRRKVGKTGVK